MISHESQKDLKEHGQSGIHTLLFVMISHKSQKDLKECRYSMIFTNFYLSDSKFDLLSLSVKLYR